MESQAELASLCAAYIDHSRQADRPAIVAQRDLFNDVTGLVA
jgi:mRNA-degrading endonuclease toxin of MazEF toxin-antitoxin module